MIEQNCRIYASVYIIGKCWLVAWLVGDHLLLRDFGPYGIIFTNMCVVITVAMVILLRDLSLVV
jgi:uncharacterized YccA/Bax inhibitor family protein